MAMADFAREIALEWRELSTGDRVAKVRKLCASPNTQAFIQRYFPDIYAEAFPPRVSAAGGRSGSGQRHTLCAKPL
jgi:hypothetical protein